jgi:hypothetical protein
MIKTAVALSAVIFMLSASMLTQPAVGQQSGAPGGPGAGPPGPLGLERPGGPGAGFMHMGVPPLPPTKGTLIRLTEGNRRILIKCSEDDSTKACVDAIGPMLTKLLETK